MKSDSRCQFIFTFGKKLHCLERSCYERGLPPGNIKGKRSAVTVTAGTIMSIFPHAVDAQSRIETLKSVPLLEIDRTVFRWGRT